MKRREKLRLRNSEKEYRNSVREKLVKPLNEILLRTQKKTADGIIECLGNKDLPAKEAYKCKKAVEEEFGFKMERYRFFVKDFEKKVDECLGGCRNDYTIEIVDCYEECLGKFKGFLDGVKFE